MEVEEPVVVDGVRGFAKGLVEEVGVEGGLASQSNVVSGDLLCGKLWDTSY